MTAAPAGSACVPRYCSTASACAAAGTTATAASYVWEPRHRHSGREAALYEVEYQGQRRPRGAAAADRGVGPQHHLRVVQALQGHALHGRLAGGKQPDAKAGDDHVLDQFEAVRTVRDAGLEAGQRAEDADHLIVGGVARVDDPVVVTEPAEGFRRGPASPAGVGRDPEAPPCAAERADGQVTGEGGRREVVVVDQREIGLVAGQQAERLGRLVLVYVQADE